MARRGHAWDGVIAAYRPLLPVSETTPVVTLYEGNTPLIPLSRVAARLGIGIELFAKCEAFNPTGSFKDRGMTVAVSKALESGTRGLLCASTGNTSASAAAFAARAGLPCFVLVPQGAVAPGKLSQAVAHGARVLAVRAGFDVALRLAEQAAAACGLTLVNSINPLRIEGQKTAAFEIVDQLGRAPDVVAIPVGNAGNITAYWKGFCEYRAAGRIDTLPRMFGFQAAGAAPIVEGRIIKHPQTIASAIRIGRPASWEGATRARDASGGLIDRVSDAAILEAQRLLADHEGIFCEPASAAALAGLIQTARDGRLGTARTAVCIITGHGLKDPAAVGPVEPQVVDAELSAIERVMSA
ncbi:MAG TPA: threonine synthase [Limnochordia bacterium]